MSNLTQYNMKGLSSTKNTLGANKMSQTRSYKMMSKTATTCSVAIKVGGREKCLVSFALKAGSLVKTFPSTNVLINPVDMAEVTSVAKRAFKIS